MSRQQEINDWMDGDRRPPRYIQSDGHTYMLESDVKVAMEQQRIAMNQLQSIIIRLQKRLDNV